MLYQEEFNELRVEIVQMLDGLALFKGIQSADDFDVEKITGSAIAQSIVDAFNPLTYMVMGSIIPFRNNIDATHPLATSAGRQASHSRIFDNLAGRVTNESGRLGRCLESVAESSGRTKNEIKEMIDVRISELKSVFEYKTTYAEKNEILGTLREFYDEIRDSSQLEEFVSQNSTSCGL